MVITFGNSFGRGIAALALAGLLAAGCTSSTDYGPCVGVTDDRDPGLAYKVSGWNVAMGVIFVETIFAPLLVVFNELQCPVGVKGVAK